MGSRSSVEERFSATRCEYLKEASPGQNEGSLLVSILAIWGNLGYLHHNHAQILVHTCYQEHPKMVPARRGKPRKKRLAACAWAVVEEQGRSWHKRLGNVGIGGPPRQRGGPREHHPQTGRKSAYRRMGAHPVLDPAQAFERQEKVNLTRGHCLDPEPFRPRACSMPL